MEKNELTNIIKIIPLYRETFELYLSDQLNDEIIQTLSNMLSFHFMMHPAKEIGHSDHAKNSVLKLKHFLANKIIIENEFSIALELFAIAISDDSKKDDNISNKTKEAIIEQIANEFDEMEGKEEFLGFIDFLLYQDDADNIINYLTSNKNRTREIFAKFSQVPSLSSKPILYQEMTNFIRTESLRRSNSHLSKITIESVLTIFSCSLMTSAGIIGLNFLAPIAVLPAAMVGLKIFTKPIENTLNFLYEGASKIFQSNVEVDQMIEKLKTLDMPAIKKVNNIHSSILQEAHQIISGLGLEEVKNIKINKEHTKEAISKAEAIKNNIGPREY